MGIDNSEFDINHILIFRDGPPFTLIKDENNKYIVKTESLLECREGDIEHFYIEESYDTMIKNIPIYHGKQDILNIREKNNDLNQERKGIEDFKIINIYPYYENKNRPINIYEKKKLERIQEKQLLLEYEREVELHDIIKNEKKITLNGEIFFFDLESDFSGNKYTQELTIAVGSDGFNYKVYSKFNLKDLEYELDRAKRIVIHNDRYDLSMLLKYFHYNKVCNWKYKSFDFLRIIESFTGDYISLADLTLYNGLPGKTGKSDSAPSLWKQNRLRELIYYCKNDVYLMPLLYFYEGDIINVPIKSDSDRKKIVDVIQLDIKCLKELKSEELERDIYRNKMIVNTKEDASLYIAS
jgi:hypothetical protein